MENYTYNTDTEHFLCNTFVFKHSINRQFKCFSFIPKVFIDKQLKKLKQSFPAFSRDSFFNLIHTTQTRFHC